ncbi:MAG: hypothetical protein H6698_04825 [Myxococcales bacterium]|nr:hypothetical protein [Myxococcales bacterium]MCB9533625.1 hypothetical protein [Myxococcales bacterium]
MPSRRRLYPAAVVLATLAGCSSDSSDGADASADARALLDAGPAGPSDDAARVDVEVEPTRTRTFRLSLGAPPEALGSDYGAIAWRFVGENADVLRIELRGGLPWAEIIAGGALPEAYDAFLDEVVLRARELGTDLFVVVDPLDDSSRGLAPDALGRALPESLGAAPFADPALRNGYESFCVELADRLQPRYFAPVVGIDAYTGAHPDETEAITSLYQRLHESVKFASPETLVFPIYTLAGALEIADRGPADRRAWLQTLDASIDLFAVAMRPVDAHLLASELDLSLLEPFDRSELGSLTTRRLALTLSGYPGEGVVLAGVEIASSENSQYNFLAFVLSAADRLGAELVDWAVPVDPDAWLADPCTRESCDDATLRAAYAADRRGGLEDINQEPRAARELWSAIHDRELAR